MILRTRNKKSRRRSVEIYFVLYLSALLIILSEKPEGISTADGGLLTTLTGMSFSVRAEKSVLSYNYSLTNVATSTDTSNSIAVLGNVKNVSFTLYITDLNNGRTARLEPNDPNSMFTFRQDENEKIARFALVRSRIQPLGGQFTVKVVAKAQLDVPENIGSDEQRARVRELFEREGTQVIDSTEFSIVIIPPGGGNATSTALAGKNPLLTNGNTSEEFAQPQPVTTIAANNERNSSAVPVAPSSLAAQYPLLETVSYQEWENIITVYGTTNLRGALKAPPKVYTFPTSEGVSVKSVNESSVVVGGIAPESGTMTVRLVAEFRNNSAPMQVEFSVSAKKLAKPVLPDMLYPEQTYSLNPRLPLLKGQSVRAVLLDGDDERLVSREGEAITLQPTTEDIGKTFYLVRYVNDKKIGENYVLPVRDLPPPEILSIVKSSPNEAIVTVRSYGTYKKAKNMARLTFSGDCLSIRPRHGDYQYDKATLAHIQLFTVQLKDNPERATCELTATDLRGVVSKSKNIQQ